MLSSINAKAQVQFKATDISSSTLVNSSEILHKALELPSSLEILTIPLVPISEVTRVTVYGDAVSDLSKVDYHNTIPTYTMQNES